MNKMNKSTSALSKKAIESFSDIDRQGIMRNPFYKKKLKGLPDPGFQIMIHWARED